MTDLSQTALDRADELVTAYFDRGSAPAVVYGVVSGGELAHSAGYGVTRVGGSVRPDADSVFRIASMTKSFTATALLILRERGRLHLDDPVVRHVPELAGLALPTPDAPELTVRHLLTMAAGLPTDDPWGDRQVPLPAAEFDDLLRTGFRFVAAPGERFEYSNLGYAILGRVIANVAGTATYDEFVHRDILAPLGLSSTAYEPGPEAVPGYRRGPAGWVELPPVGSGAFAAMGGLLSTVRDLTTWVAGFTSAFPAGTEDDHPLRRAARREMQRPQTFVSTSAALAPGVPLLGSSTGYGCGLFVYDSTARGRIAGHSGGFPGYGSHMRWHPETQLGVITLTNATYAAPATVATEVLDLLIDAVHRPVSIAPWPDTSAAAARIEALVRSVDAEPDHATADALFAENVDLDRPRDERFAGWRAISAEVGAVGAVGEVGEVGAVGAPSPAESDGPAHARWHVDAASGRRTVAIRLSPQLETRVQTVEVGAIGQPSAAMQAIAESLVAAIARGSGWPTDVPTADGVDVAAYRAAVEIAHALAPVADGGRVVTVDDFPVAGDGRRESVFVVHTGSLPWRLTITLDPSGPVVTGCRFEPRPVTTP